MGSHNGILENLLNGKCAILNVRFRQRYTIQMKLILLCVWAERAVLSSAKNALKFKYEIEID